MKLPPLTYKIPANAPYDLRGKIVKAPLMGKSLYGLVVSVIGSPERNWKNIREIESVHQRFASESNLSLLKWLSDYYLAPMGTALNSSFFEETIKTGGSNQQSAVRIKNKEQKRETENSELSLVYDCIKEKNYRSFLFHPASISQELSILNKIMGEAAPYMHGAIILVPEIGQIERLLPDLKNIFGERLCVLHSRLTAKKRMEAAAQILAGRSDVVLGTRSAVLAPLKNVSFIAVTGEHSNSYKGEEGLRYNARDVAVMRGFIEKSCVLLSSVCPSVESIYNTKIGKYTPLNANRQPETKRPRIKIVGANRTKGKASTIAGEVLKEAKNTISKKGKFLFLINRKGYSLIRCEDCGHTVQCKKCGIPLVFYKAKNAVKCNYCGLEKNIPESCEECKGFAMKPSGAGTEKIKEEVEELLGTKTLLLEKERSLSPLPLTPDILPFVVGTTYAAKKLRDEKFDAAALFNIDQTLSQPDFRAYERTFQQTMQIAGTIKPDGSLFLQTWNPKNRILRFIKNYDFHGFYEHELSQRKTIDYPPFSKIVLFNISYKKGINLLDDIRNMLEAEEIKGLEVLGPVEIPPILKSYPHCIQILLKSKDSRILHSYARQLLNKLEKIKDVKINADVDPLKV
ncbi:MAG: primosomal protein N' [Nitrospirae bacterium]|nr:primosomal protein N' [Nitrospirota bacterium]